MRSFQPLHQSAQGLCTKPFDICHAVSVPSDNVRMKRGRDCGSMFLLGSLSFREVKYPPLVFDPGCSGTCLWPFHPRHRIAFCEVSPSMGLYSEASAFLKFSSFCLLYLPLPTATMSHKTRASFHLNIYSTIHAGSHSSALPFLILCGTGF